MDKGRPGQQAGPWPSVKVGHSLSGDGGDDEQQRRGRGGERKGVISSVEMYGFNGMGQGRKVVCRDER